MIQKKRNQTFDAVRGFCMFLIPLQHFISAAGLREDMVGYCIYTWIDIFVMQAFFFLSGVFSKNPEKAHKGAAGGILWPYIVACTFIYIIMYFGKGRMIDYPFIHPAYTMWFLLVLFYFRYFQKYYTKLPCLLGIALVIYLGSGCIDEVNTSLFALNRTLSFFIFFIIGYCFKLEYLEKIKLKVWQTAILGIVLAGTSYFAICRMPEFMGIAFRLKHSYEHLGIEMWQGILIRIGILVLSLLYIIFLLNIFRDRKSIWTHIGMNTMPVYVFHTAVSGILFKTALPGNYAVKLILVFLIASSVTLIFTTKPFVKAYNVIMDGSLNTLRKIRKKISKE